MDVTAAIQEFIGSKTTNEIKFIENCIIAVEANQTINWKTYFRILGVLRKRTEYAIVIFTAHKLADGSISEIRVLDGFPFNNKLEFKEDQSRIASDSHVSAILRGEDFTIGDLDPLCEQAVSPFIDKSIDGMKTLYLDVKKEDFQRLCDKISVIVPCISQQEDFSSFTWLGKLKEDNPSSTEPLSSTDSLTDNNNTSTTEELSRKHRSISNQFLQPVNDLVKMDMTQSLVLNKTEQVNDNRKNNHQTGPIHNNSEQLLTSNSVFMAPVKNKSTSNLLDNGFSLGNTSHNLSSNNLANPARSSYLNTAKYDNQTFVVEKKLKEREQEYCDYHNYTIFVGSWNVNDRRDLSFSLDAWLKPPTGTPYPHFYVFGFQELDLSVSAFALSRSGSNMVEENWIQLIEASKPFRTKSYKLVERVRLAGILLIVYAEQSINKLIRDRGVLKHPTGIMNMMGNKGGVGIRFRIMDTYLVFVNCHLAAGENNRMRRDSDFKAIERAMTFVNHAYEAIGIYDNDLVFLCGDLNYRVNMDACKARITCDNRDIDTLLKFDELKVTSSHIFKRFHEGKIKFLPTYKFEPGTDSYDCGEKNRVPSYCDRILWCGKNCKQLYYNSVMDLKFSDHKPIYSWFSVGIKKINKQKRNKIHEAIIRHVDTLFNMSLPNAELDRYDLVFEKVHFQECRQATISIKNTGQNEFMYQFKEIENKTSIPEWITVEPSMDMILAGETKVLTFQVFVNPKCISTLNVMNKIESILILDLQGGKDCFITVNVDLVPTSYGLPLTMLANLKEPVASISRSDLHQLCKPFLQRPAIPAQLTSGPHAFMIPKEVFVMVDFILKHLDEEELFARPGIHPELHGIFEQIDTKGIKAEFSEFSVHSVIEAFLVFLSSLYFPIIPNKISRDCLAAANNFEEAVKIITKLPIDHQNLFHYLMSFLRKVIEHRDKNSTHIESLSMLFVDVLFGPNCERMPATCFIQQFVSNSTSTYLRPYLHSNEEPSSQPPSSSHFY